MEFKLYTEVLIEAEVLIATIQAKKSNTGIKWK